VGELVGDVLLFQLLELELEAVAHLVGLLDLAGVDLLAPELVLLEFDIGLFGLVGCFGDDVFKFFREGFVFDLNI